MSNAGVITDKSEFSALRTECESIFDVQKRLPEFVFKRSFARYLVIEYGYLYDDKFGTFLHDMSRAFGDEFIRYMTLDPDAHDHYYKQCLYFGVASFDPETIREEYASTMSAGPGQKFLVSANVGAYWGSSRSWGIMCDRISWELALIGVSKNIDVLETGGFRCMDASALSSYIDSQYAWKNSSIAPHFMQELLRNYRI